MSGYSKDWSSGGCIPTGGSQPPCSCDPRGSTDLACINDQYCRCRDNVEGTNCDRCKPGTFGLDAGNSDGCIDCFCSGVTDECSDARLFWSTLRLNAYDKKYLITDRNRGFVKDREVGYGNQRSERIYQVRPEEADSVFYWQLPQDITGNRIGSYGGNLSIIQRYVSSNPGSVLNEPAVIMVGAGRTLLYPENNLDRVEGEERKYKVPILEQGWMVENRGRERPATREDLMSTLSDLQVCFFIFYS